MTTLLAASLILNVFLVYLVWHRFRAERVVIGEILNLSANEKRYVLMAMNNEPIDPSGLDSSEIDVLDGLSERGWLFPMGNGTYAGGATTNAEYLARSYVPPINRSRKTR